MVTIATGYVKLDYHLEERHHFLPKGGLPIWISLETLEQNEMKCLQPYLKELTKELNEITVISRLKNSMFKDLCKTMNWKYANIKDIIGSEVSCLISFGIPSHQNLGELFSRARNCLIVITEEKK